MNAYTARVNHREEATWTIRIEASAEFDENYDGDLDGFAWREKQFRELQNRAVGAVLSALSGTAGWRVRTGYRGLAATDEVLVLVVLIFGPGRLSKTMSELGKGIRSFRDTFSSDEDKPDSVSDTNLNPT